MKRVLTNAHAAAAAPGGEQDKIFMPGARQASVKAESGNGRARRAMLIAGVAAAGIMTGMPAFAAEPPAASSDVGTTVGEVVVTANKQNAAKVLKVPESIQAISGQQLQKQGVIGFMDVAGEIPGLSGRPQVHHPRHQFDGRLDNRRLLRRGRDQRLQC